MPKALLISHHFDWTPIGDSETIVLTLCRKLAIPGHSVANGEGKPQTVGDGPKIRIITYARRGQVFDLYKISAAVFSGQNAALERDGKYRICLMVRCRYRT
jgi:hypothetical protein